MKLKTRFSKKFTAKLWKRIEHLKTWSSKESRHSFSLDTRHTVITPFKAGVSCCTKPCVTTDARVVTTDTLPTLLSTLRREAIALDGTTTTDK